MNIWFLLLAFSYEEVKSQFQVLTVHGANQQRPGDEQFLLFFPKSTSRYQSSSMVISM